MMSARKMKPKILHSKTCCRVHVSIFAIANQSSKVAQSFQFLRKYFLMFTLDEEDLKLQSEAGCVAK